MKRLKVSLPGELRARLDAASAESGRSLADEIRMRVEASFAREAVDKPTRDFLDGLALMPAEIERETGAAWHSHAGAFAVFRQAILSRLARLKAQLKLEGGSIAFGKRPHQVVPGPGDPHEIGLSIEQHLHADPNFTNSRVRRATEETLREIIALHQSRQKGKKS
jgi:hypothetical protein